ADIANGNITLKGWYLSTVTFYFTDLVWFALAIKLFGYSEWITRKTFSCRENLRDSRTTFVVLCFNFQLDPDF
ncbi:hypothetical protein ONO84_24735, partial [Salmonella enterica subsp. enterica serovar Virginia]|nr:hypothetical protein [Salmonella enterica subsp. enterica serovar Virginia]